VAVEVMIDSTGHVSQARVALLHLLRWIPRRFRPPDMDLPPARKRGKPVSHLWFLGVEFRHAHSKELAPLRNRSSIRTHALSNSVGELLTQVRIRGSAFSTRFLRSTATHTSLRTTSSRRRVAFFALVGCAVGVLNEWASPDH